MKEIRRIDGPRPRNTRAEAAKFIPLGAWRARSLPARCTPVHRRLLRPEVPCQAASEVVLRSAVPLRFRLGLLALRCLLSDVTARFLVLRDERIEPVLREARPVVACESGCGERRCRKDDDRGERRSFHDSPRDLTRQAPSAAARLGSHIGRNAARRVRASLLLASLVFPPKSSMPSHERRLHRSRACAPRANYLFLT